MIGLAVAAPLIALLWLLPDLGIEEEWALKLLLSLGALLAIAVWCNQPRARSIFAMKDGMNAAIADELGIEYSKEVKRGEEWKAARIYGLVPRYNKSSFEDCWTGEIDGHAFKVYEAHLSQRDGSDGGSSLRFRGAIISVAFGRRFRSTTLLQRAGVSKGFLGFEGASEITRAGERLQRVTFEDREIGNQFEVYSTDQVEAHRLIHPAYLARLRELGQEFQDGDMRALFHDGMVVIALDAHNMFESGGLRHDNDRARIERTVRELEVARRIARAFNQDKRGEAPA
jgi:hypothetical protein